MVATNYPRMKANSVASTFASRLRFTMVAIMRGLGEVLDSAFSPTFHRNGCYDEPDVALPQRFS